MPQLIGTRLGEISKESKKQWDAINQYLEENSFDDNPEEFLLQSQSYVIAHLKLDGLSDDEVKKIETHLVNYYMLKGQKKSELIQELWRHRKSCHLPYPTR